MAIRAIVFDLFDTLVDLSMESLPRTRVGGREFPSTLEGLHRAATEGGMRPDLDLEEFAAVLLDIDRAHRKTRHAENREFPTIERFEILCHRLDLHAPGLPEALTQIHMKLLRSCASLPGHHPEVLRALRRRVPLALCSNFSHSETALAILEDYGLAPHLDVVVISEDVGFRKPDASIFEIVLERLGVAPGEALHVGDNLDADVGGASGAGMQTAWLTRRVRDPLRRLEAHDGKAPQYEIGDLGELAALVDAA